MKKAVVAILVFLYLGMATGIVMNMHYCMGQLSSVEYGYNEHDHCASCGMEENDGCCNTEFKVVKLQDLHQWAKSDWLFGKYAASFSISAAELFSYISPGKHHVSPPLYYSPPDYRMNDIYLHTAILRI